MKETKRLIKNISWTVIANAINVIVTAAITFLLPEALGVNDYSYYQLYLFYIGYTGFLHFGWADGVFLRYGGEYYEALNKRRFSAQFILYSLLELILALAICIAGVVFCENDQRMIVLIMTGISVILLLPRTLLQYILQCTNRITEYALILIIERMLFLLVSITCVLFNVSRFLPIIIGDLIGKLAALSYAVYQCRAIVFVKPEPFTKALKETWNNISIGIKLMFANIASLLIIGIVRLAIEKNWDIVTFGKISLTLSVSNLLLVFIRAVSLVMFPMLRRTSPDRFGSIYNRMRTCIIIPMLGLLIAYYPVKQILLNWLPSYRESLEYMALMFPMCIYESKMSMLVETYMKTLRMERNLLIVNVFTVFLSFLFTGITVYILNSLDLAVASIVILLAVRCIIAEMSLSKSLQLNVKSDIILELLLTGTFICTSWFIGGINGILIYLMAYLAYLLLKRKEILELIKEAKRIAKISDEKE